MFSFIVPLIFAFISLLLLIHPRVNPLISEKIVDFSEIEDYYQGILSFIPYKNDSTEN